MSDKCAIIKYSRDQEGAENVDISYPQSWNQDKKLEFLECELAATISKNKCAEKEIELLIKHAVVPITILQIVTSVYFSVVSFRLNESIEQKNKTIQTLEKECGR